jgi:hypothetical protein
MLDTSVQATKFYASHGRYVCPHFTPLCRLDEVLLMDLIPRLRRWWAARWRSLTGRGWQNEGDVDAEVAIERVLRGLARQRVSMSALDGPWPRPAYVENAMRFEAGDTMQSLLTCYLRGWAEPADPAIFSGEEITFVDGQVAYARPRLAEGVPLPEGFPANWRLTDRGWAVLQRSYRNELVMLWTAVIALILTVVIVA